MFLPNTLLYMLLGSTVNKDNGLADIWIDLTCLPPISQAPQKLRIRRWIYHSYKMHAVDRHEGLRNINHMGCIISPFYILMVIQVNFIRECLGTIRSQFR